MKDKKKQKQHLIDMMESDEELGLYDEKIEDIEPEEDEIDWDSLSDDEIREKYQ